MKELAMLMVCPICGKKYSAESTKLVQGVSNGALLHVSCSFCGSASLAILTKAVGNDKDGGNAFVTIGMMTDLSFEESRRLIGQLPVSLADVLDFYEKGGF